MDLKVDSERFLMDVGINDEHNFVSFKRISKKIGVISELSIEDEKELPRKRKKACYLPLLNWLKRLATNPCDPAIGEMPERSKWKAYGGEHEWKRVLMMKEAMRLNVNGYSNMKQSIWKKLKMHPDMYDDQTKKRTSKCSQRLISARETPEFRYRSEFSSTGSRSDIENGNSFWTTTSKKKRIPLGRFFQAELPQWTGETYKTETRWLGTRVWPLENTEKRSSLIERERMGKGRQVTCGCQFAGSLECVRFHIAEKRSRVKLELGSAFAKWKFDTMGEDVSLKWTRNEEKKFARIIQSTPESSGISFWYELSAYFKNKTMAVLVSYYFNVYLLRRRAHQNRSDPSNIDSDDDELQKSMVAGSILCSPKKEQAKFT